MTVVTETTWKSSNPANPASTPITRANSDVSLYMPVRRRSVIQKPGIATRSNSTRDGFGPSRPNFRYSHPPTPSLSRQQSQQSLDSYRSGVVSMPPRFFDPNLVPRVVTPCEEDYQSIGAFKLGSLRITNGAASPVSPEVEKHDKDEGTQGRAGGRAEYFVGVKSEAGLMASNALQIILNSEEPPKVETEASQPQPQTSQWSPIAASFQKGGANTSRDLSGPDRIIVTDPTVMAADIPQYLDEINFSPFSLYDSSTSSPKLQTTSKSTALEDQLFDDEPQAEAEYSSVEVLDVRLDPSAKSQHGQATDKAPDKASDTDGMMTVERTDSGFVSITSPAAADTCIRHKPLTKADSGYSSNVSLRSLQLKSQVHDLDTELTASLGSAPSEDLPVVVIKPIAVPLPPQREAPPPPVLPPVLPPQREAPPPPVPPKDYPSSPTQPTSSSIIAVPRKSLSTNTHSTRGFLSPANAFRSSKKTPTPIKSIASNLTAPSSPNSLPLSPASARSFRSDNSGSTLSISSGSQKPSKLQRLLSSARRPASGGPLTVHATHVFEKTGIPSIPRHVEHKLHEHTGMFPITTKRLALKPRSSMDTLKTIFSVGSMEASLDAVNSISGAPRVSGVEPKDKEPLWRHTLQSVPSHIAHVAAQVIPRKPIARKPIPTRQESGKKGTGGHGPSETGTALQTEEASPSTTRAERTMSLTFSLEQKLEMKLARAGASVPNLPAGLASPALPSPLFARAPELKTRTPPPISMMNRRPGSLRVPPPLRSQSSTASLNRRASRESLYSQTSSQSLARKTSRDNVHSYPSYQNQIQHANDPNDAIPPVPTMDPRRISAFRRSQTVVPAQPKAPNWDVQTDHDITRQSARTPLEPVGRHNSLSSSHRSDGLGIQRSASAQGFKAQTGHPPLRHRSSYDGYSHQKKHLQNGHPPSMSNGYTGPPKPMSMLIPLDGQFDLLTSQWAQDGRYPPYVPRANTHKRNRSMSGHGNNAPYRILHSYNSPAYRNVPIWG